MSRRLLCALLAGAFGAPALSFAGDFKNEVDVGVLSLIVGNFNGRYERDLNGYLAVAGGAGFSPMGYLFVSGEEEGIDWKYYNVNALVRLYPLGNFRGLYAQAEVFYDIHKIKDTSGAVTGETATVGMVTPAMVIGWRFVIADRATITLGGGSGYITGDLDVGDEHVDFEGIRPRFNLDLGFLF